MSYGGTVTPAKSSRMDRFNARLHCPFELCLFIGSTFCLLPDWGREEYSDQVYFDWLWFHFAAYKIILPRYGE